MKCSGVDVSTGDHIEITFGDLIQNVDHPIGAAPPTEFVAPAWIDLQVNGYAGVDYNSPTAPQEEIARSIHVQHSSSTARLFPPVITGGPDDMAGARRNRGRAKDSLPAR